MSKFYLVSNNDYYVLKDKETGKYIGRHQKGFVDSLHDAQVYPFSQQVVNETSKHLEVLGVDSVITINNHDLVAVDLVKPQATQSPVGGDHYKNLPIQPIEYTVKNNLSFLQGNIVKYVTRYKNKNGLQDLQKAKHYIDLIIQFEYIDECKTKK